MLLLLRICLDFRFNPRNVKHRENDNFFHFWTICAIKICKLLLQATL